MPGTVRLFRLLGIDVFLHWSWLFVAMYQINRRDEVYSSIAWSIAEYLALFGIVLLHEFGHALACRQVGGSADRILLWPFGGVAFVSPPPRPGAHLWSVAAGPLVNVVLLPVTWALYFGLRSTDASADLRHFTFMLAVINLALLVFNMLPIYPLDGGQILRSILWFFIGPARSLLVASVIGIAGAAAGVVLAVIFQRFWLGLMALFAAYQSWIGFQQARRIGRAAEPPLAVGRHDELHCPICGESPPAGPLWACECGASFDVFATRGACPRCGRRGERAMCGACENVSFLFAWYPPATVVTSIPTPAAWPPPPPPRPHGPA